MNEYKEFLKHLGINPMLMVANMRSRLPDSEKPMFISRCKEFEVCESVKIKDADVSVDMRIREDDSEWREPLVEVEE